MNQCVIGGLLPTGDATPWDYEDTRTSGLPYNGEFLKALDGRHVIKNLRPYMTPFPGWFQCDWIYCHRRKPKHQIKSTAKFTEWQKQRGAISQGAVVNPEPPKVVRVRSLAYIRRHGGRLLQIDLEDMRHPRLKWVTAQKIAEFCGLPREVVPAMVEPVVELAKPQCLDYMLEEEL
jgi:hypothetical protein